MKRFLLIIKESIRLRFCKYKVNKNLYSFKNLDEFFKSTNFLDKQKLCQKNITLALY